MSAKCSTSFRKPGSLVSAEPARGPFGARIETLEAMVWLGLARLLIAAVRFDRWRGRLGQQVAQGDEGGSAPEWIDRYLARVVLRAVRRMPFDCACLPQAMALHWMLHRRARETELVIAALPAGRRGSIDDLHAWVEKGGEILLGESDLPHQPLIRFRFETPA